MTINIIFWLIMGGIVVLSYGITFKRMTRGIKYDDTTCIIGLACGFIGVFIGIILVSIICVILHFLGIAKTLGIIFPI